MAEHGAQPPTTNGSDTVDTKTVDETLRKYDQESAFRSQLGIWKWVVLALGSALTASQLYTALFGNYVSLVQGAIHVAGAMSLVYLLSPAKKAWASKPGVAWYDAILCGLTLWTNFHIVNHYQRLTT